MASVLTSQPGGIAAPGHPPRSSQIMAPRSGTRSPDSVKHELEHERGRPRGVSDDKDIEGLDLDDANDQDGDDDGHSSNSEGPARKRKRSRKGLDKKFECPEQGCGKSYSRAEHLYVLTPRRSRGPAKLANSGIEAVLTQC